MLGIANRVTTKAFGGDDHENSLCSVVCDAHFRCNNGWGRKAYPSRAGSFQLRDTVRLRSASIPLPTSPTSHAARVECWCTQ